MVKESLGVGVMTKTKRKYFAVEDYKHMETFLESMAEKGWLLTKYAGTKFTFESCEPVSLDFNVSVLQEEDAFDFPDESKQADLNAMSEESGWTYCTHNNLYQIFFKGKNVEAVPFHTEPEVEYENLKKVLFKSNVATLVFLLYFPFIIYQNFKFMDYTVLLSNGRWLNTISPIFIMLLFLFNLFHAAYWLINNKRRLKQGLDLQFSSVGSYKFKSTFNVAGISLYLGIVLLSFIELSSFNILIPLLSLSVGIPLVAAIFMKKRFKTVKRQRKENIRFFVIAMIVLLMISMGGSILMMMSGGFGKPKAYAAEVTVPVLNFSDFTSIDPVGIRFKEKGSIFVPTYYEYMENSFGAHSNKCDLFVLRTEYALCKNNHIFDYVLEGMFEEDRVEKEDIQYLKMVNASDWGVDRGYYLNNMETVILIEDMSIYRIHANLDFTDPAIIEICKSKLF